MDLAFKYIPFTIILLLITKVTIIPNTCSMRECMISIHGLNGEYVILYSEPTVVCPF